MSTENLIETISSEALTYPAKAKERRCLQCLKIIRETSPYPRDGQKFCGLRCMGDWRRENWKGKNNPAWTRIILVCPICKKEFSVTRSQQNRRRCCSRRCYAEYKHVYHRGQNHKSSWKGGKTNSCGYPAIYAPEHPRNHHGHVRENILMAEKALGKALPSQAVVHHVNGNIRDNRNCNLVVCENQSYHRLLHVRMKRLREGKL